LNSIIRVDLIKFHKYLKFKQILKGLNLTVEAAPRRRLGGGWASVGRALSDGSGHQRLGRGEGRSSGETWWHGCGAGRWPVWLDDGKVLMADEEDGGLLDLGCPSRRLGLGSEPGSMVSCVAPGR
jgi:hypothetical protein